MSRTTPRRAIDIVDALADPKLFGALPAFRDLSTWRAWVVFLAVVYGVALSTLQRVGVAEEEALCIFREHTGRTAPRPGGYPEAALIVGVQSGKTQVSAIAGVLEAARAVLAGQRGVYVPLVAQDLRSATRALFAYAREAVQASPVLRAAVVRETSSVIEFTGGVTLGVYPCRPHSLRGIRAAAVLVDELAFFVTTDGRPTDTEMLRVARGRVATTGGRILILSSPYHQTGALYELHRRHYGRDDSETLIWQARAPAMNPTLPADYVARMRENDPEAARSEIDAEFRTGVLTFFDPDALEACVDDGERERAPKPGVSHVAGGDAASGSGKDAYGFALAHKDGERVVVDVVRAWKPPFNPTGVTAEIVELLTRYRVTEIWGDRYAPGFVSEAFRAHGITYRASGRTTSETFLELLPLVNSGAVRLLDDPELLRELRGLERRRGQSGRDRVEHKPGAHDDRACAAAHAIVRAARGHALSPESTMAALRAITATRRPCPWDPGGNWGPSTPGEMPGIVPSEGDDMEIYHPDGSVERVTGLTVHQRADKM
jgi:hypothetical protein